MSQSPRQGEILGLRWENVDLERRYISVSATLTKDRDGQLSLRTPTGKRSWRVDLGSYAVSVLREHRKQRPLSQWVFCDSNGNALRQDNFMHRVFRPLVKKAGIGHCRFHDLRLSSGSLSVAAGENIKVVQEKLGHASPNTTLRTYVKVHPTLQREAAERIDSILSADGAKKGLHDQTECPDKTLKAV